mgnify:FL=1
MSSSQSVRKESAEAKKRLKNMFDENYARRDLYSSLRKSADTMTIKNDSDKYFVQKTLAMFERSGASIDDESKRKMFGVLKREITELQLTFEQNINEDTSFVLFEDEELVGVDKNFISSLPKTSDGKKRKVVLKRPLTYPIQQRAHLSSTRKKLIQALGSKCAEKNTKVMQKLLRARSKLAHLMGYKSHSDFMLQAKMASNLPAATSFCENMIKRMQKKLEKELGVLKEVKKSRLDLMKDENENVESHDKAYLIEVVKQRDFKIDSEKLKEFFPLDSTIDKILDIYANLLGLKITRSKDLPRWHEDVIAFEIRDNGGDASNFKKDDLVGHFYLVRLRFRVNHYTPSNTNTHTGSFSS